MTTIAQATWEDMGRRLFGEDKKAWQFECPMCGNVQSIAIAMQRWPELEGRGWEPHTECIGRYLEDRGGCDWAAYGLFRGPLLVEIEGREQPIPVFDFDRKAYEAKGVEPLRCDAKG